MKLFLALIVMVPLIAKADPMPLSDYEVVPYSASQQTLGPVGGSGDVLDKLLVAISATTANKVYINDGSGLSVVVFPAGAAIGNYTVYLGARSVNGAWKVTTDTNASVIAVGRFK